MKKMNHFVLSLFLEIILTTLLTLNTKWRQNDKVSFSTPVINSTLISLPSLTSLPSFFSLLFQLSLPSLLLLILCELYFFSKTRTLGYSSSQNRLRWQGSRGPARASIAPLPASGRVTKSEASSSII
jgi:hypothetical protein